MATDADPQLTARAHSAAIRLHDEFAGTFGVETIERLLVDSAERLSGAASTTSFVPLLASASPGNGWGPSPAPAVAA